MEVTTTRFGLLEIDPDSVIEFPAGLVGIEQTKHFKLLHEEGKHPTIFWLQSLDDVDISITVADPAEFNIAYEFILEDNELELLQLDDPSDLALMMILYRDDETMGDALPDEQHKGIRASTKAPLLFNLKKRIALQKVLPKISYTTLIREEV